MTSIVKQATSTVLMIRPVNFGYNPQTAVSNFFQVAAEVTNEKAIQIIALLEFDAFVEKLRAADIEVMVFDDTPNPHTPDSVFPNNWVSFHEDGRVILYPMEAHNRRLERKESIINALKTDYNIEITEVVDLSYFENENKFLEGTGSMIIDRQNKLVYACHSSRTHPDVLKTFCDLFGYKPLMFHASDINDLPVYHTNVVMAVGENIAVICADSIKDKQEKSLILNHLSDTGKKIIEISLEQMQTFAGNMLQLKDRNGKLLLVMSQQGFKSLTEIQIKEIQSVSAILYSDIQNIEKFGGGSARCMIAEIFNKKN